MARILYRVLDLVDFILPWTIVVPFSMFTFGSQHLSGLYTSCVDEVKRSAIRDLKSGMIKELFLKVWLRENTVNRVIFNNNDFKMWSLELFKKVVRNHKVQQRLDLLISRTINLKELNEKVNRGFTKQKQVLNHLLWKTVDTHPWLRKEVFGNIFLHKLMKTFETKAEIPQFDYIKLFNLLK